ncbi:interleukin-1 alpha isoform X2 [Leopardus geoffroyi]|uniref:Interleukin-1 n=1 Tax=Acinonyx jubatus TaxID=32536 RepID=A0A6J1XAP5_ACIJB|nr:interleukin-1 alpha isoform X2 [Felis catus]XP_026889549.1 interleukin-1 alpha isoform X2 [Acinonyx jubatus]XP_040352701.1 interleukin-1 alpha isoform X3 [Puma yagouaroundi]XP_045302798.1 interleukin-1 alpha isoform X2 [Leopardus geoffroyi]
MAKVPDLFEDLKNCYSENEEYSSEIDHLTLNQKSFYDASYDPLHEDCTDKFMSPSTSETSKTPQLTLKKSVVMVAANGKILKKRRLSLNQFLTADDLEAIANEVEEVKFDMGAYTSKEDSKLPVTLRISKTRLFVSAQNEDEPVLLKEMPETPKTIRDETNLLFFWERHGSKNYFKSVAHPKLFIATQEEKLVHMARGLPSVTDFQILETQS